MKQVPIVTVTNEFTWFLVYRIMSPTFEWKKKATDTEN